MSLLRAVLGDSLREARDRRALLMLLILETLVVVACFGLSFQEVSAEQTLEEQIRALGTFVHGSGDAVVSQHTHVKFTPGTVRPVGPEDDVPDRVSDGLIVEVTVDSGAEMDRAIEAWDKFRTQHLRRRAPSQSRPTEERRRAFLVEQLERAGFSRVDVKALDVPEPPVAASEGERKLRAMLPVRFRVAAQAERHRELAGGHRLGLLFGLAHVPLSALSAADLTILVQMGLTESLVGFLGILVAIMVTSGFVPGMLQKGTLDLVLARPVSRAGLLLAKYLGGLWFVFLLASWLVVGCWLGLWFGTGNSNPWFLFSALTLTAQFAILYSVSVLAGVLFRSAGLASLLSLGVWGISSVVVNVHDHLDRMFAGSPVPPWLHDGVQAAYVVLPKARDLQTLNSWLLTRSQLSPQAIERHYADVLPQVDWLLSMGTTAGFVVVMLGLACWVFHRRDY